MLIAGTSTTIDQESELVLLQQQRAGPTNQRDDIITTISLSDWFAADVPFFLHVSQSHDFYCEKATLQSVGLLGSRSFQGKNHRRTFTTISSSASIQQTCEREKKSQLFQFSLTLFFKMHENSTSVAMLGLYRFT